MPRRVGLLWIVLPACQVLAGFEEYEFVEALGTEECEVARWYCLDGARRSESGRTLARCSEFGVGYAEETRSECPTAEECQNRLASGASRLSCEGECSAGDSQCSTSPTDTQVVTCNQEASALDQNKEVCLFGGIAGPGGVHCLPKVYARCFTLRIDGTEVTRDAYQGALSTLSATPRACVATVDFNPDTNCEAGIQCGDGSCPQTCVDWCDAYAFCAARGQRLCGRIALDARGISTGGHLDPEEAADPSLSEWTYACSSGGQFAYATATGGTPGANTDACLYDQAGQPPYPVGSRRDCHGFGPVGGYGDLWDLSGNVSEWTAACDRVDRGL